MFGKDLCVSNMNISFLVPTCNRTDTLKEAVFSIINQPVLEQITYEIIINDDGDTNSTKDFITELAVSNPNVIYSKNPIKGQFQNLNYLVSQAKYDWIVFLHDDDRLESGYLSSILNIENVEKFSIVWTGRSLIDASGNKFGSQSAQTKSNNLHMDICGPDYFYKMVENNDYTLSNTVQPPMVTGLLIKKDLACRVPFNPIYKYNADGLFLWEVYAISPNVLYINAPLVEYRWVDNSERAKPSEKGIVFSEMKAMLLECLEFCKANLAEFNLDISKKVFLSNFYTNTLSLDGSITWLALRYKASYISRVKLISDIALESLKYAPNLLFRPKTYIVLMLSVMPRFVLHWFYKLFLLTK